MILLKVLPYGDLWLFEFAWCQWFGRWSVSRGAIWEGRQRLASRETDWEGWPESTTRISWCLNDAYLRTYVVDSIGVTIDSHLLFAFAFLLWFWVRRLSEKTPLRGWKSISLCMHAYFMYAQMQSGHRHSRLISCWDRHAVWYDIIWYDAMMQCNVIVMCWHWIRG